MSLVLVLLTAFLGMTAVGSAWTEINEQVGFFYFNLMWVLAGITGVFLALDLFLFYFFWEMMLVPMYFIIAVWGHENRIYAAVKFFLFTQISGLLMLLAIIGLYFVHGQNTGVYTFDYRQLLGTAMSETTAMWLMLGFLVAFLVKLPAVPVHTWLPDAHTEAPTPGSVILAGLLLKTGAYGLLRFVVPLFPQAAFGVCTGGDGAGDPRDSLRRAAGFFANRSQAAGGLHERQSHGLCAARCIRLERDGPAGCGAADPLSWYQHRRALYSGGIHPGAHPHPRYAPHGGAVGLPCRGWPGWP